MNLIKSQIHFHPCCLFLLFIFCGFRWNNISCLRRLPLFFERQSLCQLAFCVLAQVQWKTLLPVTQYQKHRFPTDLDKVSLLTDKRLKRRAHQLNKLRLYLSFSSNIYFQGKSSSCKYCIINLHIARAIIQFLP